MTSNDIKVNINIENISLVRNLIELLEKYIEELPQELQDSIYAISGNGLNDFEGEDLRSMYSDFDPSKVDCSEENVIKINKLLKKVVIFDDGEKEIYPLSFFLKYDGETIIEWGNND